MEQILASLIYLWDLLIGYGIPFVIVLSVVVFVHEFGHFIVGRWSGVKVLTFSMGFGPELAGWTDRKGTRWRIAAIPLGGYVRFFGDADATSTTRDASISMDPELRKQTLKGASLPRRTAIVAAGPVANFILAVVIMAGISYHFGRFIDTRIDEVEPGSAAFEAGIMPGDSVVSINGSLVDNFTDIRRIVSVRDGQVLDMVLMRGEQEIRLAVTPRRQNVEDGLGGEIANGVLGIRQVRQGSEVKQVPVGALEAVGNGFKETWFIMSHTVHYIGELLVGKQSVTQLRGPVGIADVSGKIAAVGVLQFIQLIAILSVSIGMFNLLPVPMLDGGHLLYYAIEAIRGRPLSERVQEYGFRIGFAFMLMLIIFVSTIDLRRTFIS